MGCWETVDKSGFYGTDQRKIEQKLVALRRQMKQEELSPPRQRRPRHSKKERTKDRKRTLENDLQTTTSPGIMYEDYAASQVSAGSDSYWRSLTPELSERIPVLTQRCPELTERYVATLDVPETKQSPKRSKSILSLGNTSVISEAKGLWSTKDLNEDKLILEEITTIRKLTKGQTKPIE